MQSSDQVKKITEYEIGERVYEGDYYAGRIVSMFISGSGVSGYILLVNSKEEYTIYRGINNRCSLTLTRNIPEPVALQFAQAILGKEEIEEPPCIEKMYGTHKVGLSTEPVIKTPVKKEPVVVEKQEISSDSELSLYFDFV